MVDICTWRARIGAFLPGRNRSTRQKTRSSDVLSSSKSLPGVSYCVLAHFVISMMLILAGDIELNPGPLSEEQKKCLQTMSHDQLKGKGNECILKNNYDDAIIYYSSALEKTPESHTVLSNRSFAYSRLGNFPLALKDANTCIQLKPDFARGYLRKSVALYGLKSYEESMVASQEGYKLRASDSICKDCISQWMLACKEQYCDIVESSSADCGFKMPKRYFVTSTEYLRIYLVLLHARLGFLTVDTPFIKGCLSSILDELDRVLQLFGHSLTPVSREWCGAYDNASKLNPKLMSRVSSHATSNLLEKSRIFSAWLDTDIDPVLFPIVSSIFSLLLTTVGAHYINLNAQNTDHHVVQVACRSVLTFFNTSMLSTENFIDVQIAVYKELLESFGTSPFMFTKEEVQIIMESIRTTEELIKKCPKNAQTEDICDKATVSISLARIRMGEDAGIDFTSYAKESGEAISMTANDDPEKFKAHVLEKREFLQLLLSQSEGFPSSLTADIIDLLDCVGSLIDLGEIDEAVDIMTQCELAYVRIFHDQLGKASYTLDEAPSAFSIAQIKLFSVMSKFIDRENWLVANIVLRWKCIYSEFRALLIKLGVGQRYFQTFQAIQKIQVKSDETAAYAAIAEEHQEAIKTIIKETGQNILTALMTQSYDDIKKELRPGEIVIDYLIDLSGGLHGVVVAMLPDGKVLVYVLEADKIISLWKEWAQLLVKVDDANAEILAQQLGELLFPGQLQAIINSANVTHIYMCPDWPLGVLPLELLSFSDGKLLVDKCSISYLSSARELLRRSTYEGICVKSGKRSNVEHLDVKDNVCVIVADPDYDLKAKVPKESQNWGSLLTNIFDSLFAPAQCKPKRILPIANSKEEALDVERVCSTATQSLKTRCLLGNEATLFSVLQLKNPAILHFSTHGFSYKEIRGVHGSFWADTWTGLVLAGVNTYRFKQFDLIADEAGTGELTSLAVCGMNLQGTKLVYLSTCVSSHGFHISGEAVNSLAQAFRAAGAQTVVATLWQIVDEPARNFSVHFYYKALEKGVRPSVALVYAKNMLRMNEDILINHQYFWSSFVCIGEDCPVIEL